MKASSYAWALAALVAFGLHLMPRGGRIHPVRRVPPGEWYVPAMVTARPGRVDPVYREETLGPGEGIVSVHVASLAEYAPGRLAVAWYGGSREGARDVAVLLSTRETVSGTNTAWSPAAPVVNQASAQRELGRFVKKVGNPLLVSDGGGRLQLLFVSIAVGGWSGSSLNLKQSDDGGGTWTPARRLVLSPFFNVSELVKNAPVRLFDGGFAVPVYQECLGKFPELLWLEVPGAAAPATRSRPFGGRTAFQPALVPLDSRRAILLCRTAGDRTDLFGSRTDDGGQHWSAPEPVGLPNPDSGIAAIRLSNGRLLLAFNDSTSGRENLRLAVSDDGGANWKRAAIIAAEADAEFSYPFLLQTSDGIIHLAYTWKRQAIRHVEFNETWLDSTINKEATP